MGFHSAFKGLTVLVITRYFQKGWKICRYILSENSERKRQLENSSSRWNDATKVDFQDMG